MATFRRPSGSVNMCTAEIFILLFDRDELSKLEVWVSRESFAIF